MKTQNNQIDFSGQRIFVGIDVHKKNWKVNSIENIQKMRFVEMEIF